MSATERLRIILSTEKQGQGDKQTSKGLESITKAAKFVAGAFAAIKSAEVIVDFAKVGAEARRQAGSLDNLAESVGTSGEEIIAAMQEASDLTVDRMSAMSAANKALVMDVAKTPDEFAKMTKVATALGRAMGQDAAKSIDDFTTAAARQSMQIADNLGLTVSATRANALFAAKLGKTADALTDAEKKQAFLNLMLVEGEKKMAALGDEIDEMAKIEMLTAAVADAKTGFAELFVEMLGGVSGVKELSRRIRALPETFKQVVTIGAAASAALQVFQKASKGQIPISQALEKAQYAFNNTMLKGVGILEEHRAGTEQLHYAHLAGLPTYEKEQAMLETLNTIRAQSATGMTHYTDALGNITASVGMSADSHNQYQAALAAAEQGEAARAASTLALAAAQVEADAATQKAISSQLELAASLKGANEAQIAQAAIQQLGAALADGDITAEQYNTAVRDVQLAFGLADEASMNLATNMMNLTTGMSDGTVEAGNYATQLGVLVEQHAAESLQLETYGELLDTATQKAMNQTTELGSLSGAASDTAGQVDGLKASLDALPTSKTITINYKTTGSPSGGGGNVPQYAGGTTYHPGGMAWVGEFGAELVELPRGAKVYTAGQSRGMAAGGATITIVNHNHIQNPDPVATVREIENYMRLKGQVKDWVLS